MSQGVNCASPPWSTSCTRTLIGISGRWHGLELPYSMVGQKPWSFAVFDQVIIRGWK